MLGKLRDFFYILPKANPIANINAFANVLEGYFERTAPLSLPLGIDVVLTKACNLRCSFCVSYGSLTGERWMPFDLYERIARRLFWKAHDVFICSGGEPLLYPRIRDALKLASDYRTRTTMTSNGMLLDLTAARWMVEDQSVHELCISFDGATRATLERIRRGADYAAILRNLGRLDEFKKALGLEYPRVGMRYVIMNSNAQELPEIFEICARHGLYKVEVKYLNVANDMDFDESLFNHRTVARDVFGRARERASEFGLSLVLPPLPGEDSGRKRCRRPWRFCQIDTDGSIRFCYHSWRQRIGFFGDDFGSIWRGENYGKIRRSIHSAEPYYPYCLHCAVRVGYDYESSHNQKLYANAYAIPGLEDLQTRFNKRSEENASALGSP